MGSNHLPRKTTYSDRDIALLNEADQYPVWRDWVANSQPKMEALFAKALNTSSTSYWAGEAYHRFLLLQLPREAQYFLEGLAADPQHTPGVSRQVLWHLAVDFLNLVHTRIGMHSSDSLDETYEDNDAHQLAERCPEIATEDGSLSDLEAELELQAVRAENHQRLRRLLDDWLGVLKPEYQAVAQLIWLKEGLRDYRAHQFLTYDLRCLLHSGEKLSSMKLALRRELVFEVSKKFAGTPFNELFETERTSQIKVIDERNTPDDYGRRHYKLMYREKGQGRVKFALPEPEDIEAMIARVEASGYHPKFVFHAFC